MSVEQGDPRRSRSKRARYPLIGVGILMGSTLVASHGLTPAGAVESTTTLTTGWSWYSGTAEALVEQVPVGTCSASFAVTGARGGPGNDFGGGGAQGGAGGEAAGSTTVTPGE